jgi:hypothetical protein
MKAARREGNVPGHSLVAMLEGLGVTVGQQVVVRIIVATLPWTMTG